MLTALHAYLAGLPVSGTLTYVALGVLAVGLAPFGVGATVVQVRAYRAGR